MMLHSWWFRLYTWPFMVRLLQFFGVTLALDLLLTYGEYNSMLVYLLPLAALVNKFTPGSFRENIEFHKMSVPFTTLRRNFLTDIAITAGAYLSLFMSFGIFSRFAGGFFSTENAGIFLDQRPGIIFFYSLAFCIGISWVCFIAVDKKYVFYGLKHRTFAQKVFFFFPIWLLCLFQMMAGLMLEWGVELSYTYLLGVIFSGSSLFFLKAIFHRGPTHATLWNWLKHYTLGNAMMASIFGISAFIGREDVLDENLSVEQRISSIKFYGRFSPKIDRATFFVIEPRLDLRDRDFLYGHLGFRASSIPLTYFMNDTKEHYRLMAYLDRGYPSADFLMSLYSHMKSQGSYWNKVPNAEWVRQKAFHRWPKNRILPVEFLAEKKKADDFAELRKIKRGVASGSGR